jgi:hypothetical protein
MSVRRMRHDLALVVTPLAACLASVMATVAEASTAHVLDQSQTSSSAGSECLCEPHVRLAQTFTARVTGRLDRVELLLYRVGNAGDLSVELRTASAGAPSNIVLSATTVRAEAVPEYTSGWVSVALDGPAVTAGTQYAIVLSAPAVQSASPLYSWDVALGNPYAVGDAWWTSVVSGGDWILVGPSDAPLDRAFKTFVTIEGADTVSPVIVTRGNVVREATSAAGATVAYTVTATDDVDGLVPVNCEPASDRTFPIGDTTVTCTARDAAGNSATGVVDVHVNGAAEQLAELKATVEAIPDGRGLAALVHNAQSAPRPEATCQILFALAQQARARKSLDADAAANLAAATERVRSVLEC